MKKMTFVCGIVLSTITLGGVAVQTAEAANTSQQITTEWKEKLNVDRLDIVRTDTGESLNSGTTTFTSGIDIPIAFVGYYTGGKVEDYPNAKYLAANNLPAGVTINGGSAQPAADGSRSLSGIDVIHIDKSVNHSFMVQFTMKGDGIGGVQSQTVIFLPTDEGDPSEPSSSSEPSKPVDPSDSKGSSDSTIPSESTKPTGTSEPDKPDKSSESDSSDTSTTNVPKPTTDSSDPKSSDTSSTTIPTTGTTASTGSTPSSNENKTGGIVKNSTTESTEKRQTKKLPSTRRSTSTTTSTAAKKSLPKTGEDRRNSFAIAGLVTMMISIWGMMFKRR